MDHFWGAGGLDRQYSHRQELTAGLLDEYYCRNRWSIPGWVGLHTDYRSHSHGWLELDRLYRFGHWRGRVAGTDQPGVRPKVEINTADRCQPGWAYTSSDLDMFTPQCTRAMR